MSNFICPYTKSVCSPTCDDWEFEKVDNKTIKINTFIPIEISVNDFISGFFKPLINNIFPEWVNSIYNEYQNVYETYHPDKSIAPRGHCKKLEKISCQADKNDI